MNTAQHWNWQGYIKDIAYDPTNQKYYMLYGQQHNNIADYLISYDVATDAWQRIATTETTINTITRQYEMWQLATADFNDFYILATVHLTEGDEDTFVRGTYDALESNTSHIKILKWTMRTNTWTTVDDINGNAPQLGCYYSAFTPPTDTITRYPMLPDTRHTFTIKTINTHPELIYRGKNGFHTYRLSDGTKGTLKTIPVNSRRSMDCYIGNTPETTFYAWIEQKNGNAVLRIDNGNGTEITNKEYDNSDNPLYKAPAHPATGDRSSQIITISDMVYHGGELYAVLQIKAGNATDIHAESEGYLINIKVGEVSNPDNVNPIKHYQHFTRAARSPVIYNGEIYYFEGSHYQYQPHAANVTRAGILQIDASEPYPNDTGNLIRMDGDEHIDFGLCWRSAFDVGEVSNPDNPSGYGRHGGTASPMISDRNGIQLIAGYGDLTKLNEPPVNDINNWHWIQFGTRIPQRVPIFHTNDKQAWERLNTLAKLTNSTISTNNSKFSFLPRRTRQTTLIADITDTQQNIIVQDASRFDDTGLVLINDELIRYNFLGSNELSDFERGAEGSTPTPHKKGDTVLFVDALAFNHPDKKNIASLNFKPDFLGIYNQLTARLTPITAHKAEVALAHKDSIDSNGEKPRNFNFDLLTWHERPWAETLLNAYLNDMHKAQYEVNITMPWAPHLKLGQTLVVDQQLVAHLRYTPVRILRISHDFETRKTHITARTFTRQKATSKPITFTKKPDDQTFVINEEITPVQLPKAIGDLVPITYSISAQPPGITFTDSRCELTGIPTVLGTTVIIYTAKSSDLEGSATTRFRITVVNPLSFDDTIPRDVVFNEGDEIDYPLPTASGGIPPITYEISGLPPSISFINCRAGSPCPAISENDSNGRAQRPDPTKSSVPRLRGTIPAGQFCIEYRAKDAKNNTITQEFDIHGDSKPQWTSFYITETEKGRIDNVSNQVRLFDSNGERIRATAGSFNINLGTGDWRGAEITDTHKVFLDNTGNVKIYNLDNTPCKSGSPCPDTFNLGNGNWQDVCRIGTDKIGFLDRDTAAVRIYDLNFTRTPSADIAFGICADYRSITSDGTFLYVLIDNLATVLAWHISDAAFKPDSVIDLMVAGTRHVPSAIRIQPTGGITTL